MSSPRGLSTNKFVEALRRDDIIKCKLKSGVHVPWEEIEGKLVKPSYSNPESPRTGNNYQLTRPKVHVFTIYIDF